MKAVKILGSAFVFAFISIGCTRNGQTSQLSVNVPLSLKNIQRDLAAGMNIQRVMVNVSAPDLPPPTCPAPNCFIWQAHNATDIPPATISMTIPVGNSRLVQVMILKQDPSTGLQTFEYGDNFPGQTTQSGNNDIYITTTPFGGTPTGEGQIIGRYLALGDNVGKTGFVNMLVSPPATSAGTPPPMTVGTVEIFGGWINAYALQNGTGFTYMFEDGTPLFQTVANTGSSLLNGTNNVLVDVPTGYRTNGGSGSGSVQTDDKFLLGFFGAGFTTNSLAACYSSAAGANLNRLFTTSSETTPITWGVTTSSATQAAAISGGDASNMAACTSGSNYTSYLTINVANLSENGGDVLGFIGPFETTTVNNNSVSMSANYASPNMTLNWTYIPTAISGFTGVDVFYTTNPPQNGNTNNLPYINQDHGFICSALQSNGFTLVGSVLTTAVYNNTITFPLPSYAANMFGAVACPYRITSSGQKSYFSSAASIGFDGGAQIMGQVLLSSMTGTATCSPYTVTMTDMKGDPIFASATSPVSLYLSSNPSSPLPAPAFFSNSGCSVPISSVTIPANSNTATFYISNTTVSSPSYFSLYIQPPPNAPNVNFMSGNGIDYAVVNATATNLNLRNVASAMVVNQCYPIEFEYETATSGTPASLGTSSTFVPSATLSGAFHLVPDCSDVAAVSVTVAANEHSTPVYFVPTGTGSGSISAASPSASLSLGTGAPVTVASNTPSQLVFSLNFNGGAGTHGVCYQVSDPFQSSGSASIYYNNLAGGPYTITYGSVTNGNFFSDPNCITSLGTTPTVTYGPNTNPQLYFEATSAGTGGFTGTASPTITTIYPFSQSFL